MFIHFKEIIIEDKSSWSNKAILTFDVDWASDEVLQYVLDIVEAENVKCCFFVTHKTEVLQRIKNNKKNEIGIHPNFNPILNGSSKKTAEQVLSDLKQIVPEAIVLRSHSLTTSGSWLGLYKKFGITYLSNYMMNGVDFIQPFYQVNGIIEVPIYYADDGEVFLKDNPSIPRLITTTTIERPYDGIKVFNFHPIHIALNTTSYSQYQSVKSHQSSLSEIKKYRSLEIGCETFLKNLLKNDK